MPYYEPSVSVSSYDIIFIILIYKCRIQSFKIPSIPSFSTSPSEEGSVGEFMCSVFLRLLLSKPFYLNFVTY
jgi:hypothetical protein